MYTEEEAKGKWCPQGRKCEGYKLKLGDDMQEKISSSNLDIKCLASDCMEWRWVFEKVEDGITACPPKKVTDKGYCGLGGAPRG